MSELSFEVRAGVREVEFGMAFEITVVRAWSKDLVPEEWSDRALAPLVLRALETRTSEEGGRTVETRRFAAYAFELEDVVVPAATVAATPKDGGAPRTASSLPLALRVEPALAEGAAESAELPGEPLLEPGGAWKTAVLASAAGFVLVLALGYGFLRRARRAKRERAMRVTTPVPVAVPAHELALARLDRLRAAGAAGRDDAGAFYDEASAVVREYVDARFALRAPRLTSEELLGSARIDVVPAEPRSQLGELLTVADGVKFARHAAGAADRERYVEQAERFVRATAEPMR